MTKIRDIVQINSGYTSYVDLYEEYYDLVKNRGRMERYKPIAAHRQAFEKLRTHSILWTAGSIFCPAATAQVNPIYC